MTSLRCDEFLIRHFFIVYVLSLPFLCDEDYWRRCVAGSQNCNVCIVSNLGHLPLFILYPE